MEGFHTLKILGISIETFVHILDALGFPAKAVKDALLHRKGAFSFMEAACQHICGDAYDGSFLFHETHNSSRVTGRRRATARRIELFADDGHGFKAHIDFGGKLDVTFYVRVTEPATMDTSLMGTISEILENTAEANRGDVGDWVREEDCATGE